MNSVTETRRLALGPGESIEGVTDWSHPPASAGAVGAATLVYTSGGRLLALSNPLAGADEAERAVGQLPADLDGSTGIVFLVRGRFTVIAEEFGLRGFYGRWDPEAAKGEGAFGDWEPIERGDYHARQCSFPLALLEVDGEECLLHSTEWNQLDVTELATGRHVTARRLPESPEDAAAESPAESPAEAAPELDYFHGQLHLSPDGQHFISGGWVWTPYDVLMAWSVADYIRDPESAGRSFEEPMTSGYNWDRPLAFVDSDTVAWAFNQRECVEGELPPDHPSELILHSVASEELLERLPFDHFYHGNSPCGEVSGGLDFDPERQQFVAYGPEHDTVVTDRAGKVLMRSPERMFGYFPAARAGWRVESGTTLVMVRI